MLAAMRESALLRMGLFVAASALPVIGAGLACAPVVRDFPGTGGNTTGTPTGGGGGVVTSCEPGTEVECYSGPAGTKGVGECKPGKATCGDDGKPGACAGEVVPSPAPDCKAHQDQDCNGVIELCTLDLLWGGSYGVGMEGAGFSPPAVAVDASGNIVFATTLRGEIDVGTGVVASSSNDSDVFLAKMDPTGGPQWVKKIGDLSEQQVLAVKTDAQGNILIGGQYDGALDGLGIVVPTAAGGSDAFVAKLDPNGNPVWARWGGDAGYQTVETMAVSPSGDVVVAGTFSGTWSWNGGGGTLANTGGNGDVIYVQRFDQNGNSKWTAALSNLGGTTYADQDLYGIVIDKNDDVVLTGDFDTNIVFPDGSSVTTAGDSDAFVLKLDGKTGQHVWARTFGSVGEDRGYGIATDSQGNLVVAGAFEGTVSFDNTPLTVGLGFSRSVFLAKLAPDGAVTWAVTHGGGTEVVGMFPEVGENDSILLVGAFDGTLDFGGGPLVANSTPGQSEAAGFLAKLDAGGKYVAARAIYAEPTKPGAMTSNLVVVYRAALTPGTNEIVTAGFAYGKIDLGGGLIGNADITSPFLAKYVP